MNVSSLLFVIGYDFVKTKVWLNFEAPNQQIQTL